MQSPGHLTQAVNCCELTQELTQAGANENKFSFAGDPGYGYLLLDEEGNRRVEWGIVATVATALVAGPTP